LFEQVPVGLFQSAVDGRLASVNEALVTMLGHAAHADVRGARLADFIADRAARSTVQDALAFGAEVRRLETQLQQKDGRRLAVIVDVRPVRNMDGVVVFHDGIVRET
jgi:PAS domain S-box-containing protein